MVSNSALSSNDISSETTGQILLKLGYNETLKFTFSRKVLIFTDTANFHVQSSNFHGKSRNCHGECLNFCGFYTNFHEMY